MGRRYQSVIVLVAVIGPLASHPAVARTYVEKKAELQSATVLYELAAVCGKRYGESDLYREAKNRLQALAVDFKDDEIASFVKAEIDKVESSAWPLPSEKAVDQQTCDRLRTKLGL